MRETSAQMGATITSAALGLPRGSVVKNASASAGDSADASSIPGSGRSPGGRYGNPLQYSFLENRMDREACPQAVVHRAAQSWTQLKQRSSSSSSHHIEKEFDHSLRIIIV